MKRFLAIIEFTTTSDDDNDEMLAVCIRDAIRNEGYVFSDTSFEMGRLGIKQIGFKKEVSDGNENHN